MRKAVNVVVIKDNKLLAVRKNLTWILPVGKPEKDESNKNCLAREINEEIPGTEIEILNYLGKIIGQTPHKKDTLYAEIYLGKLIGELGKPSKEISEVKFVSPYDNYNFSNITQRIVDSLIKEEFLYVTK